MSLNRLFTRMKYQTQKIEKFYKKGYEAAIREMPRIKKLIKY